MGKIQNVIYILTNPQYPGYIKIGYASDLKARLSSLDTGTMSSFIPYAVYKTQLSVADKQLHRIIGLLNPKLRATKFKNGKKSEREFFKLDPEEAYELLKCIAKISGTLNCLYKIGTQAGIYQEIPRGTQSTGECRLQNILLGTQRGNHCTKEKAIPRAKSQTAGRTEHDHYEFLPRESMVRRKRNNNSIRKGGIENENQTNTNNTRIRRRIKRFNELSLRTCQRLFENPVTR